MKTKRIGRVASAGLNLNTAKSDIKWARMHLEAGEYGQAIEYIGWAMSQLEAAKIKLYRKQPPQQ